MNARSLFFQMFALVAIVASLCPSANAQTMVDHWSTGEQCLAATSAPFYYPTILHKQALAQNEVRRGIPSGACVDMDLPDRMGGRGWVRIDEDREFVYNAFTGKIDRLYECNNHVYSIAPFPSIVGETGPQGLQGIPGPQGLQGIPGTGCSVKMLEGRNYVVCGDGTAAPLPTNEDSPRHQNHRHVKRYVVGGAGLLGAGLVVRNNWCWILRAFGR